MKYRMHCQHFLNKLVCPPVVSFIFLLFIGLSGKAQDSIQLPAKDLRKVFNPVSDDDAIYSFTQCFNNNVRMAGCSGWFRFLKSNPSVVVYAYQNLQNEGIFSNPVYVLDFNKKKLILSGVWKPKGYKSTINYPLLLEYDLQPDLTPYFLTISITIKKTKLISELKIEAEESRKNIISFIESTPAYQSSGFISTRQRYQDSIRQLQLQKEEKRKAYLDSIAQKKRMEDDRIRLEQKKKSDSIQLVAEKRAEEIRLRKQIITDSVARVNKLKADSLIKEKEIANAILKEKQRTADSIKTRNQQKLDSIARRKKEVADSVQMLNQRNADALKLRNQQIADSLVRRKKEIADSIRISKQITDSIQKQKQRVADSIRIQNQKIADSIKTRNQQAADSIARRKKEVADSVYMPNQRNAEAMKLRI